MNLAQGYEVSVAILAKHGVDVTVSRQIGLPSLTDYWMTPHKQREDVMFFLWCLFTLEYMANGE